MNAISFLLSLFLACAALGIDLDEQLALEIESDRPRFRDPSQELRTTSLNWSDLQPMGATKREIPPPLAQTSAPRSLPRSYRVIIDAGHGGKDLGALGPHGLSEKDLCLRIGNFVRRDLKLMTKKRGVPVEIVLTRGHDTYLTLRDRVRIANAAGADLFVSIHANASDFPRARGFEVYFLSAEASDAAAGTLARFENEGTTAAPIKADVQSILSDVQATHHVAESSRFAETLYRAMARRLKPNGRGVRQAPFTVLAGTSMPSLLVEVGYLTNLEEAELLMKLPYLKRVANAISTGILEFLVAMDKLG